MSDAADAFLTEVFFDSRSLIAVRFTSTQHVKSTAADLTLGGLDSAPSGETSSDWVKGRASDAPLGKRRFSVVPTIIAIAVVGVVVSTIAHLVSSNSSDASLREREAALQAQAERVIPTIPSPSTVGVDGTDSWRAGVKSLSADFEPVREDLRPWMVRTLLDVPRDVVAGSTTPPSWIVPSVSPADRQAFDRGVAMAETLQSLGAERELALIIDLPGSQAVAAAAGLASMCDVVITVDNLPHRSGVVKSHETLGALLYWRSKFLASRKDGMLPRPSAWVLQGDRLAPYANQPDVFDNRSVAKLPSSAAMRGLGVKKVLYVRPDADKPTEQDDLVDLFVALEKDGIEVRHLGMSSVGSPPPETYMPVEPPAAQSRPQSQASTKPVGRSSGSSWMLHYWMYRYGWYGGRSSGVADTLYRTQPRVTAPTTGFDGGASKRSAIVSGLTPRTSKPSPGGSWGRVGGSSGG